MRHQLAAKGFPVFHRLWAQEDGGFELIHFVTGNIPAHIEVCLDDNAGLTASRNEIVESLQIAIHIEEVVVVMNAQGVVACGCQHPDEAINIGFLKVIGIKAEVGTEEADGRTAIDAEIPAGRDNETACRQAGIDWKNRLEVKG